MTSLAERAINRETKQPCGAADRHDGEVGYNDTSVLSLIGRLGAILGGVRVP